MTTGCENVSQKSSFILGNYRLFFENGRRLRLLGWNKGGEGGESRQDKRKVAFKM
jgi:hypothetical protein